jgi:hypothetical protein
MSSIHHHISRAAFRPIALALAALSAVGCSEQRIADPSPIPALAVSQESAALFETNGALSTPWGTATIKRGPEGAQIQLQVTDPAVRAALVGRAITIWAVSFHNPSACAGSRCVEADVGVPATEAAVQRVGGSVLGQGPINIAVHVREGDTTDQIAGPAAGLIDAETDQIRAVIRSHGVPIPGMVDEQIHTLLGGCAINGCSSLAVAIFK